MPYEPRTYRRAVSAAGLARFEVVVAETDLHILAERDLTDLATGLVGVVRRDLESYISAHPRFVESFVPVPVECDAPPIVQEMAHAAQAAGVGPMAAVAGAVAEYVARGLSAHSGEVIVENGGDTYLVGHKDRIVGLWVGEGISAGVGLAIAGSMLPLAVATSSGTIGPSISLGSADAMTVLARSGALADAVASAAGNRVHDADDVEKALEVARGVDGVLGAVVSVAGAVGAWGSVRLVPIEPLI
jgi:ApbE superfamily uncharacterized protein (UPF0280 family)